MKTGLLLDNLDNPADSSFAKLAAMQAGCVGTLWTAGTHHKRWIYERCEQLLNKPLYILRVGGQRQTGAEWTDQARFGLNEVPDRVILDGRVLLVCGNEPNIEFGAATEYGALYKAVANSSVPILFACPSFGMAGWSQYLVTAYEAAGRPRRAIANLYAGNMGLVQQLAVRFPDLYVGEVNSAPEVQGQPRVDFLRWAFGDLQANGVKAALVFIAGGQSNGAWDERYILSQDEAAGIAGTYDGGVPVDDPRIQQLLAQNALLTQALIAFRKGRFTGADGIDGIIVALQGGKPLDFVPSYPKV